MVDEPQFDSLKMFRNRLAKRWKHLRKWARRQPTEAWRLYDYDIPELPLYVDIYGDVMHVSWLPRRRELEIAPASLEHPWLVAHVAVAQEVTGIGAENTWVKIRQRGVGGSKYGRLQPEANEFVVEEHGLKFIIQPATYIDTGLFLDHRITRKMVRDDARGRHVLNLFGYTGSFSVYAAAGGARSTTSLDLSRKYTTWARRNLELNGFGQPAHQAHQEDVVDYLQKAGGGPRYDLVVVDPPTYSASTQMRGDFDIQRDHVRLLQQVRKLLAPEALVYFSNNFRDFELDHEAFTGFEGEEITAQTMPEDFAHSRPHRAWKLKLTQPWS